MATRIDGFRGEFLWELEIAERQIVAVAECIPAEHYGVAAPADLYARVPAEGTVRRVYLRLLAHTHEHMGQMIAYLRFHRIIAPWPDWRPDRRN